MERLPAAVAARLRARWSLSLDTQQVSRLESYADWLRNEARPEGGLGPEEEPRLWDRHLLDSLSFTTVWEPSRPPATLLDVGSGAGLPGIPLAIALPATAVSLLDRSGRRCRLLRRAVRVVGLTNVEVIEADVGRLQRRFEAVVMRAALSAGRLDRVLRLVEPEGMAAVAWARGSPRSDVPALPPGWGSTVRQVPPGVLEMPAWILIMAAP